MQHAHHPDRAREPRAGGEGASREEEGQTEGAVREVWEEGHRHAGRQREEKEEGGGVRGARGKGKEGEGSREVLFFIFI